MPIKRSNLRYVWKNKEIEIYIAYNNKTASKSSKKTFSLRLATKAVLIGNIIIEYIFPLLLKYF
ncbi:MAG: hypothetical protein ACFFFT_07145 [Candidatus Thorarchaeota archaeon]